MDELDSDSSGNVTKKEFVDSIIRKHQELLVQKQKLKEELVDVDIKREIIYSRQAGYSGAGRAYDIRTSILKIVVVEARGLTPADMLTGASDPYVIISHNSLVCKTTTKKTTLDPLWKESFSFYGAINKTSILQVTVYDYDALTQDDIIGIVDIRVGEIPENGHIYDIWFDLVSEDGKEDAGRIRLIIQRILQGPPNYQKEMEEVGRLYAIITYSLEKIEEMIEALEKPFAMFEIEKKEKAMEDHVGEKFSPGSGERKFSQKMYELSKKTSWHMILLLCISIYTFFTFCV